MYNLLIADDETDIVEMLSTFFQNKGYEILPAVSGSETLLLIQHTPDLILLDINMPDRDGLEICRRIRSHVFCPILFLTARIEDPPRFDFY